MRRWYSRNCSSCIHHIGSMYCRKNHYTECSDFEREKESGLMDELTCGDCVFFRSTWLCGEHRYTKGKNDPVNNCPNFERKNMPNIKITAEVDGKQVPLGTVSTETFEAIKALEKPKEIPVARIGNYRDEPTERRLFLKINEQLRKTIIEDVKTTVAIDLDTGNAANWDFVDGPGCKHYYENVQPL